MLIGIVGFAASGKSTVFQLLTEAKPDPGAVHSGQIGVAQVPDARLDRLVEIYHPAKVTPATIELMDTPGLNPRGGGENAQVLGLMRKADALLIVLGQFLGNDPAAELGRLKDELVFADLSLVTNRITKVEDGLKKPRPAKEKDEQLKELELLRRLASEIEQHGTAVTLSQDTEKSVRPYQLFIQKPRYLVTNRSEKELGATTQLPAGELSEHLDLSAKLELDLVQLESDERREFMADMGLDELMRDRLLVRLVGGTMGLISFFTCGPTEVRAWPITQGTTAVQAAGKIHTDLARGFIRAEVIHYGDLDKAGSEKEAKRLNLYRLEGKDYVIQDGDIVLIRFNV